LEHPWVTDVSLSKQEFLEQLGEELPEVVQKEMECEEFAFDIDEFMLPTEVETFPEEDLPMHTYVPLSEKISKY